MVMPETVRISEFTMVLLVAENTFQIFLVIQSIYSLLQA